MSLKNKIVIITGGSRGIGRACSIMFAKKGANVIINYRSAKRAAMETFGLLEGKDHMIIRADISDNDQLKSMVDQIISKYGKIDVLVNNAGVFNVHKIDEVDFDTWVESWKVTVSVLTPL